MRDREEERKNKRIKNDMRDSEREEGGEQTKENEKKKGKIFLYKIKLFFNRTRQIVSKNDNNDFVNVVKN